MNIVDIKGFESRYAVTSDGNVWSHPKNVKGGHNGKWLKKNYDSDGYLLVGLSLGKRAVRKQAKVHRLVAEAFIPNPSNYLHVNHKNGDKTDNRVENLEWVTHAQNMHHAKMNSFVAKETARGAKLNWQKVKDIRNSTLSQKALGIKYSVTVATISRVQNYKTW